MNNKLGEGFTLIELLIVVAIIGILAAIAVPNFLNAQTKAKVTRTWADMKTLVNAMEQYRLDRNSYIPDYDGIGLGGPSEIDTYKQLTTPVSYLSTIPLDVWIRSDQAQRVLRGKTEKFFEYWGSGTGVTTNPVMRQHNIGYVIRSVGPDQEETWFGNYNAIGQKTGEFTYDPSNGIVSTGDIMASNRGLE